MLLRRERARTELAKEIDSLEFNAALTGLEAQMHATGTCPSRLDEHREYMAGYDRI